MPGISEQKSRLYSLGKKKLSLLGVRWRNIKQPLGFDMFWWYGCCFLTLDVGLDLVKNTWWRFLWCFFFHQPSETLGQANMARNGTWFSQLNWFLVTFFFHCQVYKLIVEERILDPNDECSSDCTILKPQARQRRWCQWMRPLGRGWSSWKIWMSEKWAVNTPNGRFNRENEHEGRSHQELWFPVLPYFQAKLFGDVAWKFRITTWKPYGLNQFDVWTLGLWFPIHPWDSQPKRNGYQCITSHRQTFTGASIGIDSLNRYMGARINGRMPSGNQTFVWEIPELSRLVRWENHPNIGPASHVWLPDGSSGPLN